MFEGYLKANPLTSKFSQSHVSGNRVLVRMEGEDDDGGSRVAVATAGTGAFGATSPTSPSEKILARYDTTEEPELIYRNKSMS